MPVTPTYPGVYLEEIPSGVRTITGVATSITAFIGRTQRGPTNEAVTINSLGDFERIFGGLWLESSLGFAVRDFYLNGGSQGIVTRLFHPGFANDADFDLAEAAANKVATAAKAATDGAAAKTAATNEAATINGDAARKDVEKKTASAIAELIKKAADKATKEDVAKIADSAVIKAASRNKARIVVGPINLIAAYEGSWGAYLRATIDLANITDPSLFNLTVTDTAGGASERFLNLSVSSASPRRVDKVLEAESKLVRWAGDLPFTPPDLAPVKAAIDAFTADTATPKDATKQDAFWAQTQDSVTQAERKYKRAQTKLETAQNNGTAIGTLKDDLANEKRNFESASQDHRNSVSDGLDLTINDFLPPNSRTEKKGLHSLEQADLFNLLCIPPYKASDQSLDVDVNLISAAASYCEERRAMLLVDPPKDWRNKTEAKKKFTDANDNVGTKSKNAALFFPRLKQPNPLRDNQVEEFAPCGVVAGIFARTDTQRGVWKAPAGQEATLVGVPQLSVNLTDAENGELNPLGINCLRSFPAAGRVVWGARTLRGADQLADEWKYIPVRRTALFIEESLFRALQWVVFEPNDEPLWSQIRLNVGAFMHTLFRQGAFQGSTPRDAYFVKCDKETTPQDQINLGIVNIVVGFAPLKPAEFVIVKLQQMAGQIQV